MTWSSCTDRSLACQSLVSIRHIPAADEISGRVGTCSGRVGAARPGKSVGLPSGRHLSRFRALTPSDRRMTSCPSHTMCKIKGEIETKVSRVSDHFTCGRRCRMRESFQFRSCLRQALSAAIARGKRFNLCFLSAEVLDGCVSFLSGEYSLPGKFACSFAGGRGRQNFARVLTRRSTNCDN